MPPEASWVVQFILVQYDLPPFQEVEQISPVALPPSPGQKETKGNVYENNEWVVCPNMLKLYGLIAWFATWYFGHGSGEVDVPRVSIISRDWRLSHTFCCLGNHQMPKKKKKEKALSDTID